MAPISFREARCLSKSSVNHIIPLKVHNEIDSLLDVYANSISYVPHAIGSCSIGIKMREKMCWKDFTSTRRNGLRIQGSL